MSAVKGVSHAVKKGVAVRIGEIVDISFSQLSRNVKNFVGSRSGQAPGCNQENQP